MKRCANCDTPAVFDYLNTPYCDSHLPRFLKSRNGLAVSVKHIVQDAPETRAWVAPTGVAVETFVEVIEEPVVEAIEEEPVIAAAPKPAPKKAKYTPKESTPSE